jgi:DNA segregation ATPase FtsK/SpoIIIE-like protein
MNKDFKDYLLTLDNKTIDKMELPVLLGTDEKSDPILLDLINHLLFLGRAGTGKTINLKLLTLSLMQHRKSTMFYIFDSHHNEFVNYKKFKTVRHAAVNETSILLDLLEKEFLERKTLFSKTLFHNLKMHNQHCKEPLPYIVVIIDDYLSLKLDKNQTRKLCNIIKLGRTFGMFTVLSIQNKRNIPCEFRDDFKTQIEFTELIQMKLIKSKYDIKNVIPFYIKEVEKSYIYNKLSKESRIYV